MTCGVLKIPEGVTAYCSITKPAIISQWLVPFFFYFKHSCGPTLCQALCYELGLWIWLQWSTCFQGASKMVDGGGGIYRSI